MAVITDKKRIEKILDRGIVAEILPARQGLVDRLLSGDRLRIYTGADPTSRALHLSHAKNYLFLEELRELGHEVIILFGDFTAQIGDPTDRSDTRAQLSEEAVKENVADWLKQIKPLLRFDDQENPPRVLYNSEWLSRLSFKDVVSLAAHFTVQQMIERDMFEKRWENSVPIHVHEFLYPLMQGYDSVAMDVDIELCGTDQIFNALAGRTLMKRMKNKEKFVLAVNLMENPKTGELMSKSRGTGVFLSLPPDEMFGALMSQPDEMTEIFFINNTRIPLEEKENLMTLGPREAKARVAFDIVGRLYGKEKAEHAEHLFEETFSQKKMPDTAPVLRVPKGEGLAVLVPAAVSSKAQLRRLQEHGAISRVGGEVISDPNFTFEHDENLRIGKHHFFRIVIE